MAYLPGGTKTKQFWLGNNVVQSDVDYVRTNIGVVKGTFKGTTGPTNIVHTHTRQTWPQSDQFNYRERIARHESATTRLSGTRQKFISEPRGIATCSWIADGFISSSPFNNRLCTQTVRGWLIPPEWFGNRPLGTWAITDLSADAELQAKYKFFKEIKDKRTAFEGMTFLGELGESLRMLKRPLSGVRDGLDDYVKTVKKRSRSSRGGASESKDQRLRRLNDMVANTWLEKVFGWAPLFNDLDNAKEAIERKLDRYESLYQRYYCEATVDVPLGENPKSADTTFIESINAFGWNLNYRILFYKRHSVRYYGQVYTAAQRSLKATRENLGLTLNDFVPTVWELIPYSFLVDYFSNIGEMINAASTYTGDVAWVGRGASVDSVCKTQLRRYWFTPPTPLYRNLRYTMLCSDMVESFRSIERVPSMIPTVNPMQDFKLKVPGYGSTKWLNISALVAQSRGVSKFLSELS